MDRIRIDLGVLRLLKGEPIRNEYEIHLKIAVKIIKRLLEVLELGLLLLWLLIIHGI